MISSGPRRWNFLSLFILISSPYLAIAEQVTYSCSPNIKLDIPGIQVVSVSAATLLDVETGVEQGKSGKDTANVNVCEYNITLTHPEEKDRVLVQIWLPHRDWNGRFLATGGGGYSTAHGVDVLKQGVLQGYAVAKTDGGHVEDVRSPAEWALDERGEVNWTLFIDFASRSLHDMAVVGKTVTELFYKTPPRYSYWEGCSTGGRQGYMEAQKYPEDFDGILANAPAINWHKFVPAELWPQVVMAQSEVFPSSCEFDAFLKASIAACDLLDGVPDGIISDTANCQFDPFSLVGTAVECDGNSYNLSESVASVVARIYQGPRSADGEFQWFGLEYGTDFSRQAEVTIMNGKLTGVPFAISNAWFQYFLKRNPDFDTSTITYDDFASLIAQSASEYQEIIGTDNPDLSAFYNKGGKLLTWHGLSDPLINSMGTVDYHQRVEEKMGSEKLGEFYRLFLAPGVGHCVGGTGPVPVDPLGALVEWVEEGHGPEKMLAATSTVDGHMMTRNLCPYPLVARYDGHGDINSAESYSCSTSFSRENSSQLKDEL